MTQNDAEEAEDNVLLVGLGASAGGLDALKQFFGSLPEEPGMAFIVVIHLPPDHESKMAELLQRQTTLPVRQVTGRTEVESDHVYVIPPNKFLSVEDHHLDLTDPNNGHSLATADLFFRTLAAAKGRYAASIVLSGTGTDGSVGMKAIKAEGGLAMVQDPAEAAYPGMPQSAINTGLADVILPAGDMAGELLAYKQNLDQIRISETDEGLVQEILKIVQGQTGHDFSNYKRSSVRPRRSQISDAEILHQELLARLYAPPGVVIDGSYRIIHATNGIQDFLEYSGGELSKDIMSMIKPELRQALRSLLFKVNGDGSPARQTVTIKSGQAGPKSGGGETGKEESGEGRKAIDITVHHFSNPDYPEGLFHVAFQRLGGVDIEHHTEQEVSPEATDLVETMEVELEQTREQLQVSTEEYETSIEELRSSNEELQSMNEELQSTTEELETSQEELQSVNDELKTVNQQLESKVEKLRRANSDLKNLMEATHIGILFLDREFRVQRFTSAATDIFNLRAADLGRPLDHFTHRLEYDSLNGDLSRALENLEKIKKVVLSTDGRRYVMRLRPYQSTEDKIEGIVVTFVDITELYEARRQLAQQRKQESLAALGVYALEQANLGSIIHRALQQLCIELEADYTLLLSWDPANNRFRLQDQTGWEPTKDQPTAFDADKKWDAAYALWDEKPVVTANYGRETRFAPSPAANPLETASGMHMRVAGSGNAWGVIGLYACEPRPYSEEDITFIQVVANILGIAIERSKTKEALEEEVKRSKRYQRQILNNSIADRWNVGGYLHDELAQQLAAIKININSIKAALKPQVVEIPPDFTTVLQLIDDSISSIRNLSHDIIPIDIEAEGVREALDFLARELQSRHNIHCSIELGPIVDEIRNRKVASNLYLIIQEAIKNAVIHGKARQVRVLIEQEGDELLMQITDNGNGFSSTAWDKEGEGSGLNIMQHRVELHGGEFKIEGITDSQESGTRISCRLPVGYLKKEEE